LNTEWLIEAISKFYYSYGDSTGFSPVSLLPAAGRFNYRKPKIIFKRTIKLY